VIRSFAVVHQAAQGVKVPYISAQIDLDGTGTVASNIVNVDADPAAVRLGMKVRMTTYIAGVDDLGTNAIAFGYEPTS
jgi:uncharacterized OB-fold protein